MSGLRALAPHSHFPPAILRWGEGKARGDVLPLRVLFGIQRRVQEYAAGVPAEETPVPLKSLQPFLFPETLLDSPAPPGGEGVSWYVFHTRPRAEKALAERLLARSLAYFLPLSKHRWVKNGRVFTSYLPLFAGYVFFQGDREQRCSALETNLIANVLPVADQRRLHADLGNVRRLIGSGMALSPEPRIAPGTAVIIRSGPLAGVEGIVTREGRKTKVFVEVRILRQGVSVEIDEALLEPLAAAGSLSGRAWVGGDRED